MGSKGILITGKPDWMSQEDWNLIVAYSFSTNTPPAFYTAAIDKDTWSKMTREQKEDWMSRWGHASAHYMQQNVTPENIAKVANEAGLHTDVENWSRVTYGKYQNLGGKAMTNLPPSPPPEKPHGNEPGQPEQPHGNEPGQPEQPHGNEPGQPNQPEQKVPKIEDIFALQNYVRENYVKALEEYKRWKYIAMMTFQVDSEHDLLK